VFSDISLSLPRIEQRGKSVGGDGYVLSPTSAEALIDLVRRNLYFSHVDLRLLAYCFSRESLASAGTSGPVTTDLLSICGVTRCDRPITGFSVWPPLVVHRSVPSRRMREDELGKRKRNS
jgi:hypothetical protein